MPRRHPQHSVETGLERVANWNCHNAGTHYGTLRPRITYRRCLRASEHPEPLLEFETDRISMFAVESANGKVLKSKQSAHWVYPVIVGICLAIVVVVALISIECRLSALHKATTRAEDEHVSFAMSLRSEQSRSAQRLARYRRSNTELRIELRALKAEQQVLLYGRLHEVDHASAQLGGQIEATPHTEGFPSRSPSYLLQPANELGYCWGFYGQSGTAIIRLASAVMVTHIAVVHLGWSIAAPKDFKLVGVEGDAHFPLGSFRYNLHLGVERQEFRVSINQGRAFQRLRLEVTSNHGYRDTCVYRLQVYGHAEAGVPSWIDKPA